MEAIFFSSCHCRGIPQEALPGGGGDEESPDPFVGPGLPEERRSPPEEGTGEGQQIAVGGCRPGSRDLRGRRRRKPGSFRWIRASRRTAAAYSPTWWGSTIGDGGLNFSVRNGKRWFPAAIATAICYLRETTRISNGQDLFATYKAYLSPQERSRAISTGRLTTLLPVHLLPIDVVVSHDPQGKSHLEDGFVLRCFQHLS